MEKRPDLSALTDQEKDAPIITLLGLVADLHLTTG
jgi:hypothetical protein